MKTFTLTLIIFFSSFYMYAQDIQLPEATKTGGMPLMEALSKRKSIRTFKNTPLDYQTISNLLWAANGFNRDDKRTAPTAINRQELELYVATEKAIYFYNAKENKLVFIKKGDFRSETGKQDFVANASLNIIFVSDFSKGASEKYAYTDCGFVSQNIYLFCASNNLATVVRGSFDEEVLSKLLGLKNNEKILLTQSVGISE